MVCLDSSILISLFRNPSGPGSSEAKEAIAAEEACLCGQVWIEVVGGYRSEPRRRAFAELMRDYPWLDTPREAYELAAEWVAKYRGIGPGDALIAATVVLNQASLLTVDAGFRPLAKEGLKLQPVR